MNSEQITLIISIGNAVVAFVGTVGILWCVYTSGRINGRAAERKKIQEALDAERDAFLERLGPVRAAELMAEPELVETPATGRTAA